MFHVLLRQRYGQDSVLWERGTHTKISLCKKDELCIVLSTVCVETRDEYANHFLNVFLKYLQK